MARSRPLVDYLDELIEEMWEYHNSPEDESFFTGLGNDKWLTGFHNIVRLANQLSNEDPIVTPTMEKWVTEMAPHLPPDAILDSIPEKTREKMARIEIRRQVRQEKKESEKNESKTIKTGRVRSSRSRRKIGR